jgi:hypothetical protein
MRTHNSDGFPINPERFWYSIWGRKPNGCGYASGWCFGATPEAAKESALADARKWQARKFGLPVDIHLKQEDATGTNYFSFVEERVAS